ncbi:hypothetical protein LT493_40430 [Streptomyces tricolor]|nr:hypothetical protein [Streptomyces tricolor]
MTTRTLLGGYAPPACPARGPSSSPAPAWARWPPGRTRPRVPPHHAAHVQPRGGLVGAARGGAAGAEVHPLLERLERGAAR